MRCSQTKFEFLVLILVLLIAPLSISRAQTEQNTREDPNLALFTEYLRSHWDDIHDVIMRFHMDDPHLKGTVLIHMEWNEGVLDSAAIASNTSGNNCFGEALVHVLKGWMITHMEGSWVATIPFRTEIVGSNDPGFRQCGIFTGKITGEDGRPIARVRLELRSLENMEERAQTFYSNREGVFIRTLIPAGTWSLTCSKAGYDTIRFDEIIFGRGEHVQVEIDLTQTNLSRTGS